MTQIVGIGGKLYSGKDAVADHLVKTHGWVKIGMSDALADALYTLDPWILLPTGLGWRNRFTAWVARIFRRTPRPVYMRYQKLYDTLGYVRAKEYDDVRRLLQLLGTEVGRKQIDNDLWTNMMSRRVTDLAKAGVPGVIVTGIRFPNEVEAISDLGGELWWVVRPLAPGANASHSSENSVEASDFDYTIQNNGTLEDLYKRVDSLVD